jgi:hypothetical protein
MFTPGPALAAEEATTVVLGALAGAGATVKEKDAVAVTGVPSESAT